MQSMTSMENFAELPRKRRQAVVMLSQAKIMQKDVAAALAVNESTISRWCDDPTFKRAQAEYDKYIFAGLRNKAIHSIEQLLSAKSEMVRYNASAYVLDHTMFNEVTEKDVSEAVEWSEMVREAEKLGDIDE